MSLAQYVAEGRLTLTDRQLARLPKAARAALADEVVAWLRQDQRENQLVYYRPIHAEAARVHTATARVIGVQGGNRSAKSATMVADLAIAMTGIVPEALRGGYPAGKWPAPPIRARLVVTSLTNAWDINLKPKFQWSQWTGKLTGGVAGDPDRGLWGLIPRGALKGGEWEASWSEKHRVLTLANGSTCQVMSHEQELSDFDQGTFHLVVEDEIPPEEIHRANRMRVLDLGGRILVGGTPSDDAGSGVAAGWFFDQVITPGLDGSDPAAVTAVVLWTEQNRTLDAADLAFARRGLTPQQAAARFRGESLHLEGLVYPGVKAQPTGWCPRCATATGREGPCAGCGGTLIRYCHVWEDGAVPAARLAEWPVVFYMDPHQSRPTACLWVAVDPLDQWWQVGELEVSGGAQAVKDAVLAMEREHDWRVVWRKGDPKITAQGNQYAAEVDGQRFTIRRAFEEVGFEFEEALTNFTVGRERVVQALAVNPVTKAPRLRLHRRCPKTLYQLTHHTWERSKHELPRVKEQPERRHSDFPACLRYLAMDDPEWRQCQQAESRRGQILHLGARGQGRAVTGW